MEFVDGAERGPIPYPRQPKYPRFLLENGDETTSDEVSEKQRDALQACWKRFVEILGKRGEGYETLYSMKEKILRRIDTIEEQKEGVSKNVSYWEWMEKKYEERRQLGFSFPDGSESETSALPLKKRDAMAKTIVEHADSLVEDEGKGEDGWTVSYPSLEKGQTCKLEDIQIWYDPARDSSDRAPHLPNPFRVLPALGDTTWEEMFSRIEGQKRRQVIFQRRLSHTATQLRFRLDVLENVVYRFETFSNEIDSSLSKSDAEDMLGNQIPGDFFEKRPTLETYARAIVRKYRKDPGSLPDNMKGFMAWIEPPRSGSKTIDGESVLKQFQSRFREEGLDYEAGVPESFCNLLERLLKASAG